MSLPRCASHGGSRLPRVTARTPGRTTRGDSACDARARMAAFAGARAMCGDAFTLTSCVRFCSERTAGHRRHWRRTGRLRCCDQGGAARIQSACVARLLYVVRMCPRRNRLFFLLSRLTLFWAGDLRRESRHVGRHVSQRRLHSVEGVAQCIAQVPRCWPRVCQVWHHWCGQWLPTPFSKRQLFNVAALFLLYAQ